MTFLILGAQTALPPSYMYGMKPPPPPRTLEVQGRGDAAVCVGGGRPERGGGCAAKTERRQPAQPPVRHLTRKRHQQEHRPQRPTERSDPTQHAEGRVRGPVKKQQPDGMSHRGRLLADHLRPGGNPQPPHERCTYWWLGLLEFRNLTWDMHSAV